MVEGLGLGRRCGVGSARFVAALRSRRPCGESGESAAQLKGSAALLAAARNVVVKVPRRQRERERKRMDAGRFLKMQYCMGFRWLCLREAVPLAGHCLALQPGQSACMSGDIREFILIII